MGVFSRTKEAKRGRPNKKPKTLKEILNDAWLLELKKDPELKREIAIIEAGHSDLLERDRDTESQKKQIKKFVTGEALKKIQEDPGLAAQFIESQIESILSDGKSGQKRHREIGPEFYGEAGSSISQALEEVESLSALREKLQELGMVEGNKQGFFKGMNMQTLLEALPYIATIMGKNGGVAQPTRTYIVRVDGIDRELSEIEYGKLLQEGKLQPLAALVASKPEAPKLKESKEIQVKELPKLPEWLKGTDFSVVEAWLDMEPENFVIQLKSETDKGVQESILIWGFLTTATYEGMTKIVMPYKDNPEVSALIERFLSDECKVWIEKILTLVQGMVTK